MSKIAWTDQTWNPIIGCSKCSPGCANCYAEKMAARLASMELAEYNQQEHGEPSMTSVYTYGPYSSVIDMSQRKWNGKTVFVESALEKPLHWKKPRRIFICSMGDLFHESVPFAWIDQVMAIVALCPQHTFQILTKRPERMAEYFSGYRNGHNAQWLIRWCACDIIRKPRTEWPFDRDKWPLPNLWLGVTAEIQEMADKRIPILLNIPAPKRFVSLEPMLEEIDLKHIKWAKIPIDPEQYMRLHVAVPSEIWSINNVLTSRPADNLNPAKIGLDWVIVGCESGPGRRECKLEWIQSIVDQCREAGVKCFVKQVSIGGKVSHELAEWPEGLRVREF